MKALITGSLGLTGSEAVTFFDVMTFEVAGIDNNMRADFKRVGQFSWGKAAERTLEVLESLGEVI